MTTNKPIAAVLCAAAPDDWAATVKSLVEANVEVVTLAAPGIDWVMPEPYTVTTHPGSLPAVVDELAHRHEAILLVLSPVVVPPEAFTMAMKLLRSDIRVATISFWSNAASYLSFPERNQWAPLAPNGQNEVSITHTLRAHPPAAEVPIPVCAGGAVLLASIAIRALGGFPVRATTPALGAADFALTAARRGLSNLLDPTTYITRPIYASPEPFAEPIDKPDDRAWLHDRHYPVFPDLVDHERTSTTVPLASELARCRVEVAGLTIAFDASALGCYQMGTQVAILSQLDALTRDARVNHLYVGTIGGIVPDYARRVLGGSKITVVDEHSGSFVGVNKVDIIHRPFQPSGQLPFGRWRQIAERIFITVQDLIAYDNGAYFASGSDFLSYRSNMVECVGQADAIIAISHDTARMIARARLPIPAESVYVIENGTDHLRPDGDAMPPNEIVASGMVAARFLFVLGAAYSHKNRDLAIKAWQELRRRGNDIQLVLAGAFMPQGTSRDDEARATMTGDAPLVLADVTEAERNWLMKHAMCMLYPTSAEGFGLVPFEAAAFDTPTMVVKFGPLAEILPDLPVAAADWEPEAMADALETLLNDPAIAQEQIAAVKKVSANLTWDRYASRLIDAYLDALSRPSIRFANHGRS